MASIRQQIVSGVFWIAVAKYSGILISLVISAILARRISPEAYGTMAVATVIMTFLSIFSDIGIGPAIIQFKDLTKRQINSLFVMSIMLGALLSIVLFFGASFCAKYYNDAELVIVIRLLCICLFFNTLNIVPNALMTKEKRFKTIAYRSLLFQLLCGVIACFGALHGWGIYALIITPIFSAIGIFAVNFYNYPQSLFCKIDFGVLRHIASFSSFQFLFQFSNYFSRNLDKLIIGKYFNMTQLGYYDKSYRLMQLPLQNITFVIGPVLHPILSSLQNDKEDLAKKCCKLANLLSCISFPIGILFYFTALEVIRIVYGPNWDAAAPVFSILALSLPLQMILSSIGAFYQSAGDTKRMFLSGLLNTTITVAGFIIAAVTVHTIESMAWAWVITLTINFVTSYNILFRATFRVRAVGFFKLFIPQFINSTVAFLGCMAVSHFAEGQSMVVSLIIKTVFLLIATLIMAYILGQYNIITLLKQARARRSQNAQ